MAKRLVIFLFGLFLSLGIAKAQTDVTGTVLSADDGEPVIGASVFLVGTNIGTVTDVNGRFTIRTTAQSSKLRVQHVGMETQTVTAKPGVRIVLKSGAQSLDEIVVTGYGNFKKSSFTGAASTADLKKLEDVPTASIEDKIMGSVPGVSMSTNSGTPGAVSSLRIRGMGSINAGNAPLYVIDGTPVTTGNLSEFNGPSGSGYNDAGTSVLATLNSNDIESITVIKDAAAASLYGSRAANGVIVITTKQGKVGKTNVDFRSDWGFSNMAINYRPILNGDQRRDLLHLGLVNYGLYGGGMSAEDAKAFADGNIDQFASKPVLGEDANGEPIYGDWTDWKDLLTRTGHHQNYQVAVNGGNEKTKFYSSLSYMNQEGIFAQQGLERFTGNANLTHTFGRFTANVSTMFSRMNQRTANEGTGFDSPLMCMTWLNSQSTNAYDADGKLVDYSGAPLSGGVNPLYEQEHSFDRNVVTRTLNSVRLAYNIWDGLTLSEKISYDYLTGREDVLWDKQSNNGWGSGVMQRIINTSERLNTQTMLAYVKTFGQHNIDALAAFETEDFQYGYNYMVGQDYPGNLYELTNAGTTSAETISQATRLTSFLGRVNYNWANRYYASVSYREDGTSRLAPDNRWGAFWSASAAWRFSDEKFFEPIKKVFNDGKLRVSYGINGTQPSSYYGYQNLYYYGQLYNGASGMAISGIANPDLKWEKNKAFNVGLDLQIANIFNLTFDYYVRTTSDLIYDMPVSAVPGYEDGGYTTAPQNIGSLRNKGFEMTLTSTNVNTKDFSWQTTLTLAHNSNKVIKLNGEDEVKSGIFIHKVGEPYYSYYAYEYAGVDPETGAESYYVNDGTADARKTTTNVAEANKVIIGKHQPAIEGGLNNMMRYKMFDLGFTFTFSAGGDCYDGFTYTQRNGGSYNYNGAVPAYYDINEMWKQPGDNAKLPKFQYGSTGVNSSRWIMPTDYLRLKNVTFGITCPKTWLSRAGINKARVYFAASNVFTVKSKDLRVDPEMPADGLCTIETPALRTFTFGLELGF